MSDDSTACSTGCRFLYGRGPNHVQEKFYFNPGDTGFKVFGTKFGKIGVAICWDQWFPEAARAMALQGAEVCTWACRGCERLRSCVVGWAGLGWVG